jgi:hypothetical protein
MKPKLDLRIVLLAIVALIAVCVTLSAAEKMPRFTVNDHKVIDAYFRQQFGDIAPGSINRSTFSPDIERALRSGEKLPLQFQKKLETLPRELEEKLSGQPAGYAIYKLGHHVVLLRRSDLMIADIVKDAGLTSNEY